MNSTPIVIFDGVCNLCNGAVDFLIRHDRTGTLLFAPFQSVKGAQVLASHGLSEPPESIYVVYAGHLYKESKAILFLSTYMRPFYLRGLGRTCRFIPTAMADMIYRWIARNRYRWFGKKNSCRLPTPEEQDRFLD